MKMFKYRCSNCQKEFKLPRIHACPECNGEWEYIKVLCSDEEKAGIKTGSVTQEACVNCEHWQPLKSFENILCFWEDDPHGRCKLNPEIEFKSHRDKCSYHRPLLYKDQPVIHLIEDTHDVHEYCKIGLGFNILSFGGE